MWAHKEVDLAPHLGIGLVFQAGDAEKFPQALGLKSLDPFLRVSKHDPPLPAMPCDGAPYFELAQSLCGLDQNRLIVTGSMTVY